MEKNTKTTIENLQIGDRFYKANDRHKTMFTKVQHESKVTHYQTYQHWALKDAERYPLAMKADTQVVFLRHVQATVNGLQPQEQTGV